MECLRNMESKETSSCLITRCRQWGFLFLFFLAPLCTITAQSIPVPDHIVIVILENHSYTQIIGSSAAPYINALTTDPNTALFTYSYGIEHPSQPNYLDLYSGCNQGVTNDNLPSGIPFSTDNLGRQLMDMGLSFTTFSEDLPSVGFNGTGSGNYKRKHNPAANWMGTGTNQIPPTTNQPFSAFPAFTFDSLPTVSYVIPNQLHDLHDGTDPSRITAGDNWIQQNVDSYIQWARTHNSLFILTFDEDENQSGNHVLTLFCGQMVHGGQYSETINHYTLLRTIEDMYALPYACNATTVAPVTDCWTMASATQQLSALPESVTIYPNPSNGDFTLREKFPQPELFHQVEIFNGMNEKIYEVKWDTSSALNVGLPGACPGIYYVRVSSGKNVCTRMLIVQ